MSKTYRIPLRVVNAVTASLKSEHQEEKLTIVNILPPARMNQLVSSALQEEGWIPDEAESTVLARKLGSAALRINLAERTISVEVDVQAVARETLSAKTVYEENPLVKQLRVLEEAGDTEGLRAILQVDSAARTAVERANHSIAATQAQLGEILAGVYRTALLERARALGAIASIQESRSEQGLRVRITVQSS